MPDEPTLTTPRLILRPFADGDVHDILTYASNPEVSRYMTFNAFRSLTDAEHFLARVRAAPPTRLDWAVREVSDPQVFGAIEFSFRRPEEGEVHYAIDPSRWGRGLAPEAVRAVLDWVFATHMRLQRVVAPIADVNQRSLRVAEKCGLTLQDDAPVVRGKDGATLRFVTYGVRRESWEAVPEALRTEAAPGTA